MSAQIGKAALILSTNSAGLSAGLRGARADAVKGAADIEAGVTGRLSGLGGKLGGLMKLGAVGAVAGIGAVVAGTVGVAVAALDDLQQIKKQAQTAKSFGIDPSEFTLIAGMAKESGSDLRDLTESLVTMSGLGKNAAAGTEEAAKAFRLLGLDADKFNKLPTAERYWVMMDALAGVTSETDRLALAGKAFGEDGMKNVIPLIGKTSDEIKKLGEKYRLSAAEIRTATAAADAQKRAGETLSGVWRKIVIAVAPAVEVAAGVVTKLQPFFDWLGRAASTYYGLLAAVLGEVIGGVEALVGWLGELAGESMGLTGPWPTIEEVITGAFRAIGVAGGYVWDTLKAGAGGLAVVIGFVVEQLATVVRDFNGLGKLYDRLPDGMKTEWMTALRNESQALNDSLIAGGKGMQTWGDKQLAGFGSSAASVNAWFDRLARKKEQVETIAPKIEPAAAAKVAATKLTYQANTALTLGSKEELSARIRAEVGVKGPGEKQLAEAQKANGTLGEIRDGVKAVAGGLAGLGWDSI